jgi:hypothetical protein
MFHFVTFCEAGLDLNRVSPGGRRNEFCAGKRDPNAFLSRESNAEASSSGRFEVLAGGDTAFLPPPALGLV